MDRTERKVQIAEATWRVILNQGMKGATVRKIAEEAGLSLGALRHYFTTQQELLAFAMDLVKERVNSRINDMIRRDMPPKEKVLSILLELVPVDDNKMAEMEVWFAFTFHSKYAEVSFDARHDGIFEGMRNIIEFLDQERLFDKRLDKEVEAERLYAMIDGLALHAMLEPKRLDRERIVEVLSRHIDSIG